MSNKTTGVGGDKFSTSDTQKKTAKFNERPIADTGAVDTLSSEVKSSMPSGIPIDNREVTGGNPAPSSTATASTSIPISSSSDGATTLIVRPLEITEIANKGTEVTAGRKILGRGVMSTVGLRTFSHSGQTSKYAVKPFSGEAIEDFGGARTAFGIQVSPPTSVRDFSIDIASRNQVARGVAEYLGDLTGVKNPTVPIIKSHAVGNEAGNEPIELFMDVAPGKTAKDTFYGFNRPALVPKIQGEFVRQDTWLQINDFIVGQKDRHDGNVMVSFAGGCTLTGIDNDACLDTQDSVTLNEQNYDKTPPLAALPYIDREMYRAICSMSRAEIAQIMLNNGRDISREPYGVEFQRMCTRITELQDHARLLAREGKVLETREDWKQAEVIKIFKVSDTYVKIHGRLS